MSTDVSSASIPTARSNDRSVERSSAYPNIGVAILALFGREWQWLLIGAIYLLGWYTPFTDHGSAGDGPLRWCWDTWSTLRYSFGFQPYVPFAVGVVLWARREEINRFWRTRVASKFSAEHPRRRGNLIPLAIGCFLLVLAHFVQVKGVGVGAMIVITYGIAYRMYGPMMLRGPLFWPLALIWLMMPPPDHVTDIICNSGVDHVMVKISAAILSLLHVPAVAAGAQLELRGYSVEINPIVCSGANVIFATWLVVLAYQMCRNAEATTILLSLIVAAFVAICLQVGRDMSAGVLYGSYPDQTDWLVHSVIPPCLQIVLAFFVTKLLMQVQISVSENTHAPHVPHAVLKSVRVAGASIDRAAAVPFTGIGKGLTILGRLWIRSERGLEHLLKALTPKKKRSSRSGKSGRRR